MPELPEVEVVRRGLAARVIGARIVDIEVLDARSLRRFTGTPAAFAAALRGCTIAEVHRRGKFLWMPLDRAPRSHATALVAHLGMSGQLLLDGIPVDPTPADPTPADATATTAAHAAAATPTAKRVDRTDRKLCVRIRLVTPSGSDLALRFIDQRRFGSLAVAPLVADPWAATRPLAARIPASIAHIAPDPLESAFDEVSVTARMRASSRAVKTLLLDQRLVSGVGNIYADESLWLARLHWASPGREISPRKLRELMTAVREVFARSLAQGGTSFDTLYVNVNGESGYFARSLDVYGREGEPCRRCGARIRREPYAGRSSYRCPTCQRRRSGTAGAPVGRVEGLTAE